MDGALLDWALAPFAGSVAADALSEGPSCVLSAVDHRQYQRMRSAVREHAPTHDDITVLWGRLKTALDDRALERQGSTPDGSALYPEPIRTGCGQVRQQLCPCPVIKDLTPGIVKAVATERQRWAQSKARWKRGRPSAKDKAARRWARHSQLMPQNIRDLFQARFLFVTRRLTPSDRQRLMPITRGLPQLRTLRDLMEHISAFFDRRGRPQPALGKRRKLRPWGNRCTWMGETVQKVCSPTLAQALTFLDDQLLPATSHAVERGNRRYRKMQKRVYRVRSKVCGEGRMALAMLRESRAEGRDQTTRALHQARRGGT